MTRTSAADQHASDLAALLRLLRTGHIDSSALATAFRENVRPITDADLSQLMLLSVAAGYVERHVFMRRPRSTTSFARLIESLPAAHHADGFHQRLREIVPDDVKSDDIEYVRRLAHQVREHDAFGEYHFGLICLDCHSSLCLADCYSSGKAGDDTAPCGCDNAEIALVFGDAKDEEEEQRAQDLTGMRVLALVDWWAGHIESIASVRKQ